jgi:hypothetical protein
LRAQIPEVATAAALPSLNALLNLWTQIEDEGGFDELNEQARILGDVRGTDNNGNPLSEGNFLLDQLAIVMMRWGADRGQSLQLVAVLAGGNVVPCPVEDEDPTIIYIYNDDAIARLGSSVRFNHYEGLRPSDSPRPLDRSRQLNPSKKLGPSKKPGPSKRLDPLKRLDPRKRLDSPERPDSQRPYTL